MKYKFLIYISYSYAFPIGEPLQEEILKRGSEVKWFSDRDEPKKHFSENGILINKVQDAIAYQPDVVLTITDSVAHFIPGIKVQVFHGFPANKRKGSDQFKIRGFFDLYCTQGPSSTIPFNEKQKKHKNFEVVETGWSKLDPLFPLEPIKNEKPVVLIASTFTKQYSLALNDAVVKELGRLSKNNQWKFIAVLHPKLDNEVYRKFKAMENENFSFCETTDLVPLFKKADVMLADTTSALIEFLIQEKPVVTFKNNMPGPYLIDVSKVPEIEIALKKAISKPAYLMKEVKKFADYSHPYKDGKACKRVVDACIEFLLKDKSYLKKKPLNLFRKYKMRKKLDYFKF